MSPAGTSFSEIWQVISSGGLPLLIAFILWTGYKKVWVFGSIYDREVARADKAEADRERAAKLLQEKLLPAVINFTNAANKLLEKESITMNDRLSGPDGHYHLEEVISRVEAWVERLESVTTRLEVLEQSKDKQQPQLPQASTYERRSGEERRDGYDQ